MEKTPNLRQATTPDLLLAELTVVTADLVKSVHVAVAHAALRAKLTSGIADAKEVERAAEAVGVAVARATETVGQAELEAASAATACDAQVIDMAEATNFQLTPQQDSWTRNASTSEIDSVDKAPILKKYEDCLSILTDAERRELDRIIEKMFGTLGSDHARRQHLMDLASAHERVAAAFELQTEKRNMAGTKPQRDETPTDSSLMSKVRY
jgi:hypothetical protein